MNTPVHLLALLNLGGGELVLILALLILVVGGPLVLAGVIYLVVQRNQSAPPASRPFTVANPPTPAPAPDLEQQLRTLAKLKEDGVITEDDFNAKKKAILGI